MLHAHVCFDLVKLGICSAFEDRTVIVRFETRRSAFSPRITAGWLAVSCSRSRENAGPGPSLAEKVAGMDRRVTDQTAIAALLLHRWDNVQV